MADITMCQNDECPSKKKCYRFMAKPNRYHQSYALFIVPEGDNKCDMFYPIPEPQNKQEMLDTIYDLYGTPEEFREKYLGEQNA